MYYYIILFVNFIKCTFLQVAALNINKFNITLFYINYRVKSKEAAPIINNLDILALFMHQLLQYSVCETENKE